MKKTPAFILMLGFACLLSGAAKDLPWYGGAEGYHAAIGEQKKTKEPVLLYFYTTWCPYCRSFEKQALHIPQVEKALSRMRKVKIDVDFEKEIAEKYGIESFPRVIFQDASGKRTEIYTESNPKSFLQQLRKAGARLR